MTKRKRKKNYGVRFSFTMVLTQSSFITSSISRTASQVRSTTWSYKLFRISEDGRRSLDRRAFVGSDYQPASTYRTEFISRLWVVIHIWQQNKSFHLCKRSIISCANEWGKKWSAIHFSSRFVYSLYAELMIQDMSTTNINSAFGKSTTVQKGIKAILVERRLWPLWEVQLVCDILRCTTCQALSTFGICVNCWECNSCNKAKISSGKCTK